MSHGMLLTVQDLSITISGKRLFASLSFVVNGGEVVSIIGPNGCGKTTLLTHINSLVGSDSTDTTGSTTGAFYDLEIGGHVGLVTGTVAVSLRQRVVPDDVGSKDDINVVGSLRKLVDEFGLESPDESAESMSEGMLQKWALAQLMARQADLYLLDEPSNYLDLPGILALEHHILEQKKGGAGFLVVTHDRELSDRVSDYTVYLAPQGIYHTEGGATAALNLMEDDVSSRRHRATSLKRKIDQLEKDFRARAGWAQQKERSKHGAGGAKGFISHQSAKMARRAKAVRKRIERQRDEMQATRPFVPKRVRLALPSRDISNRSVFRIEDCSFRYDVKSNWVLEHVSLGATTRDKMCLMGANGAGKSTLLRLAIGELSPDQGSAYRNENVRISVIPQGLTNYFGSPRLLDNFTFPALSESAVRQFLGAAMLRREMVLRSTAELSQGELMRAAIVHAILSAADFLILDEPTSHLDLESITVLEELLAEFAGGFVIVSHDRAFVSRVAGYLYYLERGHLQVA